MPGVVVNAGKGGFELVSPARLLEQLLWPCCNNSPLFQFIIITSIFFIVKIMIPPTTPAPII